MLQLNRRGLLASLSMVGCSFGQTLFAQSRVDEKLDVGGVVRIQHEVFRPRDPRRWDWVQESNLCRGWLQYLIETDRDGNLSPSLLASWDASEDAQTYSLKIRPNVSWSNGETLSARHLLWLFAYWCDSTIPGNNMAIRLAGLIDAESGQLRDGAVKAISDLEVLVTLASPDVTFLYSLAEYSAAVIHPETDLDDILSTPIGTGAYRPLMFDGEHSFVVERNPELDYWGQRENDSRYGFLDRIEYIDLGPDPQDWNAELLAGNVDMLFQNSIDYSVRAHLQGFRTSTAQSASTVVARFNLKPDMPQFKDINLRKAINFAASNQVTFEIALDSHGLVGEDHHVCPIQADYVDVGPAYYDPEFAQSLVAQHGFADVANEIFVIDDQYTALTAEAIAAQVRDAGMNISVRRVPVAEYRRSWANYGFSLTEWNHRPLGIQNLRLAYHSKSAWNETGIADPQLDTLIGNAVRTSSPKVQASYMGQIEQVLRNNFVIIQPYWRTLSRSYHSSINGAELHPSLELDVHRLRKS